MADDIAKDMMDAVKSATQKWTKQKKSEERAPGNIRYRQSRMASVKRFSLKHAVYQVMVEAYMAASANNTLPAAARQIYYQIRPRIKKWTDEELRYGYFSQVLLPDYTDEACVDWDVVYDARGNIQEPHTNVTIGCGTLAVRNYLRAMGPAKVVPLGLSHPHIKTMGPDGNYGAVLYIEKQGFNPLFQAVDLANRYDLLIISNQGQSVTAARQLIDRVCGGKNVPLFILHDFDFHGFEIAHAVCNHTRRYLFDNNVEGIDIGLRFDDIEDLEREPAAASKADEDTRASRLRECGATEEEIEILLEERVELNALTSDAFIEMIESKFEEHGVKKIVPDDDKLTETYAALEHGRKLAMAFETLKKEISDDEVDPPDDLREQVEAILSEDSELRWDEAVELVMDPDRLEQIRTRKKEAQEKAGDFKPGSKAAQPADSEPGLTPDITQKFKSLGINIFSIEGGSE